MRGTIRAEAQGANPFTPSTLDTPSGRSGPLGRRMPAPGSPALFEFMRISVEWQKAGVEMTAELVAAATKIAEAHISNARDEDARINAQREASAERLAALRPGAFGDATDGVVYYIRRGKYVKIGTTTRLRSRMRDLMPDEILAVQPGSYSLEAQLHARFADIRFASWCEYFTLTPELQEHIDSVLAQHGPPPSGLSQFNSQA
jgi:hypothetical protein